MRKGRIAIGLLLAAAMVLGYVALTHRYVDVGWVVNVVCAIAAILCLGVAGLLWLATRSR